MKICALATPWTLTQMHASPNSDAVKDISIHNRVWWQIVSWIKFDFFDFSKVICLSPSHFQTQALKQVDFSGKRFQVFHCIAWFSLISRKKNYGRMKDYAVLKTLLLHQPSCGCRGLYKQWYTVVLHPQRLIIFNNFPLCIMMCLYVENLRWEYNPRVYFTTLAQLACR